MNIVHKPVVNFAKGRQSKPDVIVIHIGEGTKEAIYSWFNNPASEVSSHYLVCRNREIWRFCWPDDTAWGNGLKVNPTAKIVLDRPDINPNDYSISIENEGFSNSIIPDTQYEDLAELVSSLAERYNIPIDRDHIIGHHEIRANKTCPLPIDVNRVIDIVLKKKLAPANEPPTEMSILKELQRQLSILWDKFFALRGKPLGRGEIGV